MSPYLLLGLAGALWLFPVWSFRAPSARLGGFDQRAWLKGRNLLLGILDLVRAAIGANLMARAVTELPSIPGAPIWMGEVWLAAAFAVALAVQTLNWRDEDHVRAPIEFFIGVILVLIHPLVLLIGLPLGIGAALAVRAWSAGFIGAGVGLAAVSFVVDDSDWRRGILFGVAANGPVLLSVLVGRHVGAPRK